MNTTLRMTMLAVFIANPFLWTPASSLGNSTVATPFPMELLDQYYRASKRTIHYILGEFEPHLTRRQRAMLEDIEISISYNAYVGDVVAIQRQGGAGRSIRMSLGFVITMEAVQDAFIIGNALGRNDDTVEYVYEVTRIMLRNSTRDSRGEALETVPYFHQYARISERELLDVMSAQEFQYLRDLVRLHALGFVVAHELGHHFLNHLEKGGTTVEDEREADVFALELGIKAGYSPLFGAMPYMFFVAMEENSQS